MRLTVVGRRTGVERSVILGYFEDGPNLARRSTETAVVILEPRS